MNKAIYVMEERNYWLHRITGGENALPLSYPLLYTKDRENIYISIGWSYLITDYPNFYEEYLEKGDNLLGPATGYARNRWNLWRFIKQMHKGDYVLVPSWGDFSIYEIADENIYFPEDIPAEYRFDWEGKEIRLNDDNLFVNENNQTLDLGFFRKVIIVEEHIPRNEYANQELYSRMKIRQTNANINDISDSINWAVDSFRHKKPINFKENVLEEASSVVLDKIHQLLQADKLETLVQWYMEKLGATEVTVPAKNESETSKGDADVVAYFEPLHLVIMIQVKKYQGTTNNWAVEQIHAFSQNHEYDNNVTQMWVISTGDDFSITAKQKAAEAQVRLIDGKEFSKLILEVGLRGINL